MIKHTNTGKELCQGDKITSGFVPISKNVIRLLAK
jgi:hypothetical protein